MPVNVEQLKGAKAALTELIKSKHCNPIMIRLAWHDSGSYSGQPGWPCAGGATGSIRFDPEINHGANAGLCNAVALLEPIHQQFPQVSWADLIQMASAVAIEVAGGPEIPLNYGREDVADGTGCAKEGHLPGAAAPFPDGAETPAQHLRNVFYRMGFNDQEIVALSGAHTLGRARPERSGQGCPFSRYTKEGPGLAGGQSWTPDWLVFNNSYFVEVKAKRDSELLVLPTDAALFEDEGFRPHAERYAADQAAFFQDYVAAHLKLSELGAKWAEGAPVKL